MTCGLDEFFFTFWIKEVLPGCKFPLLVTLTQACISGVLGEADETTHRPSLFPVHSGSP